MPGLGVLGRVLVQLTVVVFLALVAASLTIVGRDRLRRARHDYRSRLRSVAPALAVLGAALLVNTRARQIVPDLSWIIGWNLTPYLYELEGEFLVWLQSHATPALTAYFSFIYVYGYVFVLVFPLVAYFALEDTAPLRETLYAYTFNYVLGLLCYVLIIAYGPRNMMPELVEALLYETWPEYQHLTRQVNRNTNVFPSLHTSLSGTVVLLAYRTRDDYPAWFVLASLLGTSVAISTMYLGIHWATDVVAGIVLAVLSVRLAEIVAASDRPDDALERVLSGVRRLGRTSGERQSD